MKNSFLILLSAFAIDATAQVKFTLENAKDNSANIVYVGAANTFKVYSPQEISVTNITPSQGNIRMNSDGSFSLYIHDVSEKPLELKYTLTKNGVGTELTYPTKYTIKNSPAMYQVKFGEYATGGKVSLEKIRKNHKITVVGLGDSKKYNVTFDIFYQPKKGDPKEVVYREEGSYEFKEIISSLNIGDRLFLENITLTSTGETIKLDNLNFLIEK